MYFSIIVSCYRFVTSDCLAIHIQSWFSKWSFSLLLLNICGIDDSFLSICKQRQKVIQRELLMFGHQCKADWLCYIYYFKKQSTCFKNSSSIALCINFIVICIKFYQVCLIFLSELIKVLFLIFLIYLVFTHCVLFSMLQKKIPTKWVVKLCMSWTGMVSMCVWRERGHLRSCEVDGQFLMR